MNKQIIGLCGPIGSGKDTIADILLSEYDFSNRDSFAKSLKDVLSVAFGWDRDDLEGLTPASRLWRETTDEWWSNRLDQTITPRKMMQLWGTECIRMNFHNEFWLATVEKRINNIFAQNPNAKIVISDVRFPIEAECIKKLGGSIIKIIRSNVISSTSNHSSETSLNDIEPDFIIYNYGTIEDLKTILKCLL